MPKYVSRFASEAYILRQKPLEAGKKIAALQLIKQIGKDMEKNG